jgi:hypothetical protein
MPHRMETAFRWLREPTSKTSISSVRRFASSAIKGRRSRSLTATTLARSSRSTRRKVSSRSCKVSLCATVKPGYHRRFAVAARYAVNADYHLQTGSPAIDSGTSNQAPLKDADGADRPTDGDGDGTAAFDMGAYEAPTFPPPDRTAPETTATRNPLPNAQGWNNSNVTVTLSATDNANGSGVQSIRYQLNGAPVVNGPNPSQISLTSEGTTTVAYSAVDNAGNAEPTKSLVVKIDKTVPVVSGMPASDCTLSPAKHQRVRWLRSPLQTFCQVSHHLQSRRQAMNPTAERAVETCRAIS